MDVDITLEMFHQERRYSEILERYPDRNKFPLYYKARKIELVIGPGERLFIPAGWWHYVFSEEPDEKTGLNFAINFWYDAVDFVEERTTSTRPKMDWHDLPTDEILEIFRKHTETEIVRSKSPNSIFISRTVGHRFPDDWAIAHPMSFDEFNLYKTRQCYAMQQKSDKLIKFAPKYPTRCNESGCWINFGWVHTMMHWDGSDNWLCQLQGKKRVLLFHPEERPNLYTFNKYPKNLLDQINHGCSILDLKHRVKSLSPSTCKEIEDALGYEDEVTIECDELTNDYIKQLNIFNKSTLNYNIPPVECDLKPTFRVLKIKEKVSLSTKFPVFVFWAIGKGRVYIRNIHVDAVAGDLFIHPSDFSFPTLTDCEIIVVPKELDLVLTNGSCVRN